jgi:probable F420-dependent oxidoreductase
MRAVRQFRFGVLAQHVAPSREAWVETARRVEDLGYSTLFVADHLNHPFAPFSALALAGEATRTLRLGTYVLANDYRHPVMLAKELATLDVLSGGRLEVGLGTGYRKDDYDQSGMQLDSPRVRVDRFLKGLRIVKGFFSGEPFSFSGQYYAVNNLVGKPKPLQRPRPPILIGAGSRRMLSIAAREADIIGVNPRTSEGRLDLASMTARTAVEKIKSLREVAGSRIGDVELNTYARLVAVTNHPRDAAESVIREWWSSTAVSVDDLLESPFVQIGTVDQIVESLEKGRETYGLSYRVIFDANLEEFAPVVARLAGR